MNTFNCELVKHHTVGSVIPYCVGFFVMACLGLMRRMRQCSSKKGKLAWKSSVAGSGLQSIPSSPLRSIPHLFAKVIVDMIMAMRFVGSLAAKINSGRKWEKEEITGGEFSRLKNTPISQPR